MLVEEIVWVNVAKGSQGNTRPNESNLEPEKGQLAPEEEIESIGSIMT